MLARGSHCPGFFRFVGAFLSWIGVNSPYGGRTQTTEKYYNRLKGGLSYLNCKFPYRATTVYTYRTGRADGHRRDEASHAVDQRLLTCASQSDYGVCHRRGIGGAMSFPFFCGMVISVTPSTISLRPLSQVTLRFDGFSFPLRMPSHTLL